jgi:pimeloyl-ACP methyl ester carboxylesterase
MVDGPVVLVGHSYGGMVITNVPADAGQITGLVYVCAFAPEPGENCNALAQRFPGSTLGETLRPVPLEALTEPSGTRPLWSTVPSWFVIGAEDRTIPRPSSALGPSAPAPAARWRFPSRRTRPRSPTPKRRPN